MGKKDLILKDVSDKLRDLLQKKADALPKNFNQTRFLQNALTVLSETKSIETMEPRSVALTILKGAFLGLDFFNKECYAIPYAGNLQFQTDYKGEIKLCKKYSLNKIRDIYAKLVREGDVFSENIKDGKQTISFEPKPFSNAPVIGAFAVAFFTDGTMIYESMSVEEIEAVRQNYSKQPSGQAWAKSTGEMQKKTVLRRLCKMIELDFENVEQERAYKEGSDVDETKLSSIDTTGKVVQDPLREEQSQAEKELTEEEQKKLWDGEGE